MDSFFNKKYFIGDEYYLLLLNLPTIFQFLSTVLSIIVRPYAKQQSDQPEKSYWSRITNTKKVSLVTFLFVIMVAAFLMTKYMIFPSSGKKGSLGGYFFSMLSVFIILVLYFSMSVFNIPSSEKAKGIAVIMINPLLNLLTIWGAQSGDVKILHVLAQSVSGQNMLIMVKWLIDHFSCYRESGTTSGGATLLADSVGQSASSPEQPPIFHPDCNTPQKALAVCVKHVWFTARLMVILGLPEGVACTIFGGSIYGPCVPVQFDGYTLAALLLSFIIAPIVFEKSPFNDEGHSAILKMFGNVILQLIFGLVASTTPKWTRFFDFCSLPFASYFTGKEELEQWSNTCSSSPEGGSDMNTYNNLDGK